MTFSHLYNQWSIIPPLHLILIRWKWYHLSKNSSSTIYLSISLVKHQPLDWYHFFSRKGLLFLLLTRFIDITILHQMLLVWTYQKIKSSVISSLVMHLFLLLCQLYLPLIETSLSLASLYLSSKLWEDLIIAQANLSEQTPSLQTSLSFASHQVFLAFDQLIKESLPTKTIISFWYDSTEEG